MSNFLYSTKKAFTFAEAIIALLIIGIVSAIVVPTLHDGFAKNVFQSSFADSYKNFNKGLYNYNINIGGKRTEKTDGGSTKEVSSVSAIHDGTLTSSNLFAENESITEKLAEQFKGSAKENNCWDGIDITNNIDSTSGGNVANLNTLPCFVAANGLIYAIEILSRTCQTDLRNDDTKRHKLNNSCAVLYMDVNGKQAPNTFGKDVYAFIITNTANNSLYPVGGELINYENEALNGTQIAGVSAWCSNKDENGNCIAGTCDNTLGKDGRSCAGRIVEEGMRIRYLK